MPDEDDTICIRMRREDALKFGLLVCKHCGMPPNNHFDFGQRLCAHDKGCPGYEEKSRVGVIINEPSAV